jgi:NADPH2:quinone reductase
MAALLAWAAEGRLKPHVSHRVPFDDYARAMRLLIERDAVGRVALVME